MFYFLSLYNIITVSVSTSISESDSSDNDNENDGDGDPKTPTTETPYKPVNQKLHHANTLPMTNRRQNAARKSSSSSSSSSKSSDSSTTAGNRRSNSTTQWTPSMLKKLNKEYKPVYMLRKVNSMTQTDRQTSMEKC